MSDFFSSDLSLWGLFFSSLLGATFLPGGSELMLLGVLTLHPELFWPAILLGTLGNTLGGMITLAMGRWLPEQKNGSKGAGQLKYVEKLRQYGPPVLLLAWLPLIGDALCLTAGWLRLNPWHAALYMALGKFARYYFIALFP